MQVALVVIRCCSVVGGGHSAHKWAPPVSAEMGLDQAGQGPPSVRIHSPPFWKARDDDKRVLTDRPFLQPGGGLSRFGHGSVYHGTRTAAHNVDPKTSHGHHSDFDRRVKEAKNSSVQCTFTA